MKEIENKVNAIITVINSDIDSMQNFEEIRIKAKINERIDGELFVLKTLNLINDELYESLWKKSLDMYLQ